MEEVVKDVHGNVLEGIEKDSSGHIFSKDNVKYQKYLLEKQRAEKVNMLESKMNTIETEISDIKNLLLQILNKS